MSSIHHSGPRKYTRWARVFEFQDQRPILMLHDEKPFWVKWRISGPYFLRLRNWTPIGGASFVSLPLQSSACLRGIEHARINDSRNPARSALDGGTATGQNLYSTGRC